MIPPDVREAIDRLRTETEYGYGDGGDAQIDGVTLADYIESLEVRQRLCAIRIEVELLRAMRFRTSIEVPDTATYGDVKLLHNHLNGFGQVGVSVGDGRSIVEFTLDVIDASTESTVDPVAWIVTAVHEQQNSPRGEVDRAITDYLRISELWTAAGRGFRVEEGLLRFVAPDEATYRTARTALTQQREAREAPGERSYAASEVEAIIRRTWEVALRAGMQWVRDKTMRGYDLDRFVEEVLQHRSEER